MASSRWIYEKLLEDIRQNPELKPVDMRNMLLHKYGLILKDHVIRRARKLILFKIEGRHDQSFKKLACYIEIITNTNLRSRTYISWDVPLTDHGSQAQQDNQERIVQNSRFKWLFISFKGVIDEFQRGCRPIIGVDRAHSKGPFGGGLLTAMAIDAANHCLPLVVAVVEYANNDSWTYFFTSLVHVVGAHHHGRFTIISDKCKVFDTSY